MTHHWAAEAAKAAGIARQEYEAADRAAQASDEPSWVEHTNAAGRAAREASEAAKLAWAHAENYDEHARRALEQSERDRAAHADAPSEEPVDDDLLQITTERGEYWATARKARDLANQARRDARAAEEAFNYYGGNRPGGRRVGRDRPATPTPTGARLPARPRRGPSWWPRWLPRWVGMGLGALAAMGAALGVVMAAVSSPDAAVRAVGELLPGLDALTFGDTHLVTFDGLLVDFQAVGEFVLIRSETGDLEIQIRQQPAKGSKTASLNTAVAANISGDRVAIDGAQSVPLHINGDPATVPVEGIALPNGGRVAIEGRSLYTLTWPDGSVIQVADWNYDARWLEVHLSLADGRAGTTEGLLGDADGDPGNDLTAADGTVFDVDDLRFDDLYDGWGDSWRISQPESLFEYDAGDSTETFTDPEFPDDVVSVDSLGSDAHRDAARVCREAGVTEEALMQACVLDVAVTGVAEFARATADLQSAWTEGASQRSGEAHLEVTGDLEESVDLLFDAEDSSNPPGGSFMVLEWENDQGQRVTMGTSRFTGTRAGVQIQMQLVAGAPGFSHSAFGNECEVTFTTAGADRVAGTLSCAFTDVAVEGAFDASF